jgi:ribosomal protein S1
MLTNIDNSSYTLYGSIYNTVLESVFSTMEENLKNKTVVTGTVKDMNHAGYTVSAEINDTIINLFMPHLLTDVNKLPDAESIVNTEINFMIDVINKDGSIQYIASRKKYLLSLTKEKIKNLEKGKVYTGTVTGPTSFGIFVQFEECLTAMVHKSNLSEDGKKMLESGNVKPGMQLEFFIKDFGKGNKIFGTQIDESSLWDNIKIGDKMQGAIYDVKDFGVLVALDYETKGLIHKTNLPKDVTSYIKGHMVYVKVTNVNKTERQITLNLA